MSSEQEQCETKNPSNSGVEIMNGNNATKSDGSTVGASNQENAESKSESATLTNIKNTAELINQIKSLPTRQYLDQTVVPVLLQGLSAIVKERPQEPVDFLVDFLLENKEKYNVKPR